MYPATASMGICQPLSQRFDLPLVRRLLIFCRLLLTIPLWQIAVAAQNPPLPTASDSPYVVEGVSNTIVYAVGHSLQINGTVKNGAIALGGDLIVRGVVEGDVAAIGGSVIQLEGARIGGDVMVVGGTYQHLDQSPNRNPQAMTIMYAGYEQEL